MVGRLGDDPQPSVRALAVADQGLLDAAAPLVAKPPQPKPPAGGPPPPPGGELPIP